MVLHLFCNQVTAVRFCHGAPSLPSVAQSGSASGLGPEGREFESLHSDQNREKINSEEGGPQMELNLYGSRIKACQRKALNYFASQLFTPQMIPNLHIRISYKSNMGNEYGWVCAEDYNMSGDPRHFIMAIAKDDNVETQIRTMAHEMVHVRQFVRKELDEDMTRWKSRRVNMDIIPYRELPWEIEAFRLGDKLFKQYMEL